MKLPYKLALATILLCQATRVVSAAPVTVYFKAKVAPDHNGALLNGAEIRGRYTYETTAPDSAGGQLLGTYNNAVSDIYVAFPYAGATSSGTSGNIQIFNNSLINAVGPYLDSYDVFVPIMSSAIFENPANAFGEAAQLKGLILRLWETHPTIPPAATLDDDLHDSPPVFQNFSQHDLMLTLAGPFGQSSWPVPLTYLSTEPITIPEPSSAVLLLTACLTMAGAVAGRALRNRGHQARRASTQMSN